MKLKPLWSSLNSCVYIFYKAQLKTSLCVFAFYIYNVLSGCSFFGNVWISLVSVFIIEKGAVIFFTLINQNKHFKSCSCHFQTLSSLNDILLHKKVSCQSCADFPVWVKTLLQLFTGQKWNDRKPLQKKRPPLVGLQKASPCWLNSAMQRVCSLTTIYFGATRWY